MNEQYIVSKINEYLHQATVLLASWLNGKLCKVCDDWWNECVLDRLSYRQREIAVEKGFKELSDFDLAAVLRIADKNWYDIRSFLYLPTSDRDCIRDMQSVRNNWAHCSGNLPGKDTIVRDLDILIKFFKQMEAPWQDINSIEDLKINVQKANISGLLSKEDAEKNAVIEQVKGNSEIKEKDTVYLAGNPKIKGMVFSVQNVGDITKYEVFIEGEVKTFYEGQIVLAEEKVKYNWTGIDDFRNCLSAYEITNPSVENLYSLNSARIDFVPYQTGAEGD